MFDPNEWRRVFKEAGIPEKDIEDFILTAEQSLALHNSFPFKITSFLMNPLIILILFLLGIIGVLLFCK